MNIRVQYYSYLRDALGLAEEQLSLRDGDTAGQALDQLAKRHPKLADARSSILLAIGHDWVKPDALLKEGDVLSLMPPVQGGCGQG